MHRLVVSLALFAFAISANAADAFSKFNVVLLQPDQVLQERVPSVNLLASYIGAIEAEARRVVAAAEAGPATGGFIVVALRPGQRSNIWLDFDRPLDANFRDSLIKQLRAVLPAKVQAGPVVFALTVGLWGGAAPARVLPSPQEWRTAAQEAGRNLETGELVELIWNE